MIENKRITGYHLKMIALITMLIDHIGAVLIWRVYAASFRITASMQLSDGLGDKIVVWVAENQDLVYTIYEWTRYIGRMAFPIYCFLLVEGFLHTRNVAKYAGRLAVFALVSEIPFDLAIEGTWWSMEYSNVFFTLVFGLLAIWMLSYVEKFYEFWQEKQWEPILGRILILSAGLIVIVGLGAFAEMVLCSDYGLGGIVAIVVLYLLRSQRMIAFAGAVMVLTIITGDIEMLAMLMLYPIMKYDGTRGKSLKYIFYVFYPAHLLVLALMCMGLGV